MGGVKPDGGSEKDGGVEHPVKAGEGRGRVKAGIQRRINNQERDPTRECGVRGIGSTRGS